MSSRRQRRLGTNRSRKKARAVARAKLLEFLKAHAKQVAGYIRDRLNEPSFAERIMPVIEKE